MRERGLLVRTERGLRTNFDFEGQTVYYDATRPEAREYMWNKAKEHYYSHGIRTFWLDQAEPEFSVYDYDNYRYYQGPVLKVGNIYPREYARTFYDGVKQEEKTESVVNLLRCAWVGSAKLGALVWSGDIASSWPTFRNQLAAGLNMGLAGISWWTTDIGGFHGGDPSNEAFRELFVRWFQWGAFCPVMRLHGDRDPKRGKHPSSSGADNEVWSYGEDVYKICKKYLEIREKLRPYTRRLMQEASDRGSPVMRTLFYEFPKDSQSWEIHDQYMYGDTYLCCPVLFAGTTSMSVYLPPLGSGEKWVDFYNETKAHEGGQKLEVSCPMDQMPVFIRSKTI